MQSVSCTNKYIVHNSTVRGTSQHVKTIVDRSKSSNRLLYNTKFLRSTIFAFNMDESSTVKIAPNFLADM